MAPRAHSLHACGSLALAALLLAACKSQGAAPRVPLEVPNAVSGGTRGGGRPDSPSAARMAESNALAQADRDAKAAQEKAAKAASLDARWEGAVANAPYKPGSAADDFKKVADEEPGGVHADEARYQSAVNYMADADWNNAVAALTQYMSDFPVNPHLREVERMLYEGSTQVIRGAKGFRGIFKSDKKGFDGLQSLVARFPEGEYADDALMALGDEYAFKDDDVNAALSYRELLLKYPTSAIAPAARLKLADTYLRRDQGDAYHAGYVDLDPRGSRSPQYAAGRPVVSCVETASATYRQFLLEDRSRASADQVAYAERRLEECRSRLAGKDRAISAYYARKGDASGAETYSRLADDALAGRTSVEGYAPPPPPVPVRTVRLEPAPRTLPPAPPTFAPRATVTPPTPKESVPSVSVPQPPRTTPPPYVPPPYVPPPYVPPPYVPPPLVPPPASVPTMPTYAPPGALPPPRHIETTLSPGLPR